MSTTGPNGLFDGRPVSAWRRLIQHQALSGIVGAVVGAAATVGVAISAQPGSADSNAGGATATVTVTVTAPAPGTGTDVPSPTSSLPSASGAGDVARQGELTLSAGYCVDIESTAPDWGVTTNCPGGGAVNGRGDMRYLYRGLAMDSVNGAAFAPRPDAAADLATCSAATNFERQLEVVGLVVGQTTCMRTSEGHHAALTVTAIDAPDNDQRYTRSVTFGVTVWTT